jgi:DNA-binding protein
VLAPFLPPESVVLELSKMEEVTEGVANLGVYDTHKKNRIQVSNTKKPLFFYVNLAKRYMQQHEEVELSALGMAIATVVTVAEILKNNGLAIEKRILTSTVDMKDEARGRAIQKAKVEIILVKSEHFDELMAAAAEERELAPEDDQAET